jgi:hypothetical protein
MVGLEGRDKIMTELTLDEHAQLIYDKIMLHYDFATEKPIVILPCSKQKPYSNSFSHCLLSPITRDPTIEKIVLSSVYGCVPYQFEHDIRDYDQHITNLTTDQRTNLIDRIHNFLEKLAKSQQTRAIYYIGGKAYRKIFETAMPQFFFPCYFHPPRGIRDYTFYAKLLKLEIETHSFFFTGMAHPGKSQKILTQKQLKL